MGLGFYNGGFGEGSFKRYSGVLLMGGFNEGLGFRVFSKRVYGLGFWNGGVSMKASLRRFMGYGF